MREDFSSEDVSSEDAISKDAPKSILEEVRRLKLKQGRLK